MAVLVVKRTVFAGGQRRLGRHWMRPMHPTSLSAENKCGAYLKWIKLYRRLLSARYSVLYLRGLVWLCIKRAAARHQPWARES